jgi:hypothetical protein
MMRIVRFFFWGYVLMLVGVGASGMVIAPWELSKLFEIPLGTLSETAQATLLNQYRFLKALELAFGLYCVGFRHEIFKPGLAHRVFLAGLFSGVAARLGSWLVDGQPRTVFLAFALLELITGVLVSYAVTRLRARQPAQAA